MRQAWNKISIPKEGLANLYLNQKLSISKIAKIYDCSVNPVHRCLREYEIPIRSISEAMQKLTFSKEELARLYLEKRFSTDHIGKLLGCNHVTVLSYLKRFKIPRRSKLGNRKAVSIDKKTMFNLYHNNKLTQKQIARQFGHSSYGVQRWMKVYGITTRSDSESHTKYKKRDFDGNNANKAYMIGFRLGDLNVIKVHELIQVRCSTTKAAQVELIRNVFGKYGHCHVWKAKRGTWEIVCLLNKSFGFLLQKHKEIPKWIFSSDEYFFAFFAGYADAEGSWYLKRQVGKMTCGVFTVQSYDKEILFNSAQKLKEIGVNCYGPFLAKKAGYVGKGGMRHNGDAWKIDVIKKNELWRFINLVETFIKHQDKLKNMGIVKENLIQRESLPYCHPIGISIQA